MLTLKNLSMTYSIDFRKKILSIQDKESLSFAQVAKRFVISKNIVFLWTKDMYPKKEISLDTE